MTVMLGMTPTTAKLLRALGEELIDAPWEDFFELVVTERPCGPTEPVPFVPRYSPIYP